MPSKKKKKFIDKKNAVSFNLVHRSQRDPLQADDESSKFVLQEVESSNKAKVGNIEEQQKYGIFYEDDYDYMQHLRDVNSENAWELHPVAETKPQKKSVHFDVEDLSQPQKPKLQLPAEVFPSEQEEDVGLLNLAAPISGPRLDLDPDIVAAMDDDFNFEDPDNELEDDFVVLAQGEEEGEGGQKTSSTWLGEDFVDDDYDEEDDDESESGKEDDEDGSDDENYDSDDLDDGQRSYSSEETKSRFTSYSMTSSVMRRNDGLTLLDDRFEKLYEDYDDMEIGALDQEEIEGHVTDQSLVLQQVMDEFEAQTKITTMNDIPTKRPSHQANEDESNEDNEDDEEEKEEKIKMYVEERTEKWDCESILSTYSTLYNHPVTIKEPSHDRRKKEKSSSTGELDGSQIKLSQKTGMPLHVLPSPGPTRRQQEREELEQMRLPPMATVPTNRKKGVKESAEEKRERKQAVKLARKERRVEKKANKKVFKDEEQRQEKVMQNVRQNLQGVKIL
ncbi:protein LTV1 homolog [Diadema antillarum]|uniref:protein LTV1 homolog n=1 Tax=Diadema antillarum TaxID=105358 RepID=UPI003A8920AF